MRRGLLTAGQTTSPPVTVGNTGAFGSTGLGCRIGVDRSNPANATSTVVTAKFRSLADSSGVRVFTGSLAGTSLTVRAVSPPLSAAVGDNTKTVSLAVVAGDVIGYWDSTVNVACAAPSAGALYGWATGTTTPPSPGDVITLNNATDYRVSILGTNP